jgi:hypothetical protein
MLMWWHSCVKKKENMGKSCISPCVIENGWSCMDLNVSSWFVFYLECDKRRESSSYQVYIKLCHSYVLVILFFYKIKMLSTICSNFGVESTFCHMTIVTIRRQQQRSRHKIWGF